MDKAGGGAVDNSGTAIAPVKQAMLDALDAATTARRFGEAWLHPLRTAEGDPWPAPHLARSPAITTLPPAGLRPHHAGMGDTPRRVPAALVEALDLGLADAAARRAVDGTAMRQRLHGSIKRMEAARERQEGPFDLPRP